MTLAEAVPILDGHNDVLLRLYRRSGTDVVGAFLEGEGEGQLDFPMAQAGGFVGGLFAIFVPSKNEANGADGKGLSRKRGSPPHQASGLPAQEAVNGMGRTHQRNRRSSQSIARSRRFVMETLRNGYPLREAECACRSRAGALRR
jgi:hypothetical protein